MLKATPIKYITFAVILNSFLWAPLVNSTTFLFTKNVITLLASSIYLISHFFRNKDEPNIRLNPINWIIGLFLFLILYIQPIFFELNTVAASIDLIALIIVWHSATSLGSTCINKETIIRIICFSMVPILIGFILQSQFLPHLWQHQANQLGGVSFGNRNYLFWTINFLWPISLWNAIQPKSHYSTKLVTLCFLLGISFSQSKLAIPISLFSLIWIILLRFKPQTISKSLKLSIGVFSLLLCFIPLISFFVNSPLFHHLSGYRTVIWKAALTNSTVNFWGHGWGSTMNLFYSWMDVNYFHTFAFSDTIPNLHSTPYQILLEAGFIGILLFISAVLLILRNISRLNTPFSNVLLCSIFTLFIGGIFGEMLHINFTLIIPIFIVALFYKTDKIANSNLSRTLLLCLILLFSCIYLYVEFQRGHDLLNPSDKPMKHPLIQNHFDTFRMAKFEQKNKDYYKALNRYLQLEKEATDFPMLQYNLGQLLSNLNYPKAAYTRLQRTIYINPQLSYYAWMTIGDKMHRIFNCDEMKALIAPIKDKRVTRTLKYRIKKKCDNN